MLPDDDGVDSGSGRKQYFVQVYFQLHLIEYNNMRSTHRETVKLFNRYNATL
jgi:hypothetical protein